MFSSHFSVYPTEFNLGLYSGYLRYERETQRQKERDRERERERDRETEKERERGRKAEIRPLPYGTAHILLGMK